MSNIDYKSIVVYNILMKNNIEIDNSLLEWFSSEIEYAKKSPDFKKEKLLLKLSMGIGRLYKIKND